MKPASLVVELRDQISRWWSARNTRERWIVGSGAVIAFVVLPYVWFWEPLVERAEGLRAEVTEQRRDLAWMRDAAQQIKAAGEGGAGATEPVTDGRSLLGLVDRSARHSGLNDQVSRVQPDGESSVRVWLDRAPFNDLVKWLDNLEGAGGVVVSDLTVERTGEEGLVDARLTLEVGS
ncbi:general secretion pathway protein M [Halorhodospira halochloris]|uniref:Type II secretion system protein M n=1 Tax=Halorhodospira halochloris TaxID=1052 RepID=A0A0X8X6Q7_HALHR|nr:type II secretion system protein M [Halorhodospira halochloris]MBK1650884.1 hypothetical protein [Halorhodospira halochloris]BAU56615.1 general secretion pathway protein M [Halorhodospira halochloris]